MTAVLGAAQAVSGAQLEIGESVLAGYLLAVARIGGFVLVAPPFNTRSVPARARVGVALAMAVPLSAFVGDGAPALASSALLLQMVLQVFVGVSLGFLVTVAVATLQSIGELIDVVGGFNLSMAMDPLLLVQTSVIGRLHQLVAVTVLFASDGHLMVLHGLARSMQVMPQPTLSIADTVRVVADDVSGLMLAAVQVAGPVIAAMLVADVALGLLTRAAPALNAFSLGFPLKILLTLLLAGLVVAQLPELLRHLVETSVGTMLRLTGG